MSNSLISLGLGFGGGKASTSNGRISGGGATPFTNTYSVDFDGTNDSMDVSSTSDFAFGSSGFSISFWLNGGSTNASSGFGVNVFDMRTSVGGSQPSLWIETDGASSLVKYYASGAYRVSTTATLNSGTWYHLAITNDGSTTKIYLDGNTTPIGTGSDPTTYVNAPLRIGGYHGNNYYYDGLIDEFAIFSSELSASDVSSIYNSGVPADLSSYSPLGWWRMGDNDSGTGTTITDVGSGGNDGTLTNGPTFSTNVPYNYYSLDFDGTDDYMSIADANIFSLGNGSGTDNAFSISAWFNADSIGTFHIATKDASSAREWSFRTVSSQLHFFAFGTGGGYIGRKYGTNLNTGQWYHAVVTYDASKASSGIKLYLNGTRVDDADYASGTFTASKNTSTAVRVGGLQNGSVSSNGKLDEVAIFNTALSSSDITAIYNSGVPTDITSLNPLGWWRMGDDDSGSGTTVTDQGSGGNNGTLTNGPTFSTTVPS